ncbi:hypothetical protein [uncultured Desulfosarcina sp.]|uniref:hypothetical protein n=1 Tax=uncultured Desulfosarcina sp. TaxID=218289 RepID=UPI0029C63AB5|nr:hypothetical protein [uncultured Desulfosarcina sp.]
MLTEDDKKSIGEVVSQALAAGLKNNNCLCHLPSDAQTEVPHLMGMVRDLGGGDYARGIEVMRQNNRALKRFISRVDKMGQGIAWLIVASGVGGGIWLLKEGVKAAFKSAKGG